MSDSRIDVHLTPPPDLVIDDIRVLGGQTFFSGNQYYLCQVRDKYYINIQTKAKEFFNMDTYIVY